MNFSTVTLDGGASLDFGAGSTGTISLDSVTYTSGTLDILNYDESTANLLVENDPGATFLSNLLFDGIASGGTWDPVTKQVAVPEPTVLGMVMAIMALSYVRLRKNKQSHYTG